MDFARHTGMIHEKIVKLSCQNRMPQKVEIAILKDKRIRLNNGWKTFRAANKIKNGDRCSFTLVNPGSRIETMSLSVKKLSK